MFINVVIPTCPLHIKYIDKAITSVLEQTRKADRIVCVLNEYMRHMSQYSVLESKFKENGIIFAQSETWNVAGINRKLGTEYVVRHPVKDNSIIVYHDVDDIMLPNKLEHIEYFFNKYKCALLVHLIEYQWENKVWKNIDVKNIRVIKSENINKKLKDLTYNLDIDNTSPDKHHPKHNIRWSMIFGNIRKKTKSSRVHHGLVSVNTEIFKDENLYWTDKPTGQDVLFVNEVNRKYQNSLIVLHPYCKIVGTDHVRKYGDKIYKTKGMKVVNYTPVLKSDSSKEQIKEHEGFDFDFSQYLKKSTI